jgi:Spy/CpxP family protein refolding chaperone
MRQTFVLQMPPQLFQPKDHQQFSRLLYQIRNLLSERKFDDAKERAGEFDKLAGSHIAYEESELYPRLKMLGNQGVSQSLLVGQHQDALEALRELLLVESPDEATICKIESGFENALRHAEHCGSLISLMAGLTPSQQNESLQVLIRLREQGLRWTELVKVSGK